jgi:hypothetical protein
MQCARALGDAWNRLKMANFCLLFQGSDTRHSMSPHFIWSICYSSFPERECPESYKTQVTAKAPYMLLLLPLLKAGLQLPI